MTKAPTKQILMSDMLTDNEQVGARRLKTERGLPPITYYLNFTATTNSANGVIYANWSEL